EASTCARGLRLGEKRAHGCGVAVLMPQRALGAPSEQRNARPTGVAANECRIAGEIDAVALIAQDHPFDELAGDRIAQRRLQSARFGTPSSANETERLADCRDLLARNAWRHDVVGSDRYRPDRGKR